MDELLNPYRPGAGSQPPALVGRDQLINHFGILMRRARAGRPGQSMMPVGLRGVGKTVLLNRFAEIASQEGMETILIESPENGDLRASLAREIRRVLLAMDRRKPSRLLTQALRVLKSFAVTTVDGTTLRLDVEPLVGAADSGSLAEDLTDLFVAIGEATKERRGGLLVSIDEVQYLSTRELGGLITAIHRTTQLDLPVVLVGAGLPQLPGLAGEAKSYAERLFEFPRVGHLSADDGAAALTVPAEALGVGFDDGAVELILDQTQGYPYFIQEWGYHVWNVAATPRITREVVEGVQHQVVSHLDQNFFMVRFDRLTPKEKEYLRAMAALGVGPHRSGDIARKLGVRVESVAPRRGGLIAKGMIYSPAHGDTAFTVPLFNEFLRREMPLWESDPHIQPEGQEG